MEEPLLQCYNELIPLSLEVPEEAAPPPERAEPPGPQIQVNRVQRLCDAQYKLDNKRETLRVELDLSMILIREMKNNEKGVKKMLFSSLIDCIIRINYYAYLVYSLAKHIDKEGPVILIIYLLIVPRIFLFLSLMKILMPSLHKFRNQSILTLIVLFRQNFCDVDMNEEAQKEWYDWRAYSYTYRRVPLSFYLIVPNELSYCQLRSTDDGVKTYIVSCFILKTIEMVTFIPVFLVVLYLNKYVVLHNKNFDYDEFILVLVYLDICKYIFISVFYLTKRNYQINKK